MSGVLQETLARLADTSAPALPAMGLSQFWLPLGWGVVLAGLGVALVRCWPHHAKAPHGVAAVLLLVMLLPGPWCPAYWLGLAFQLPSLATVALAGAYVFQVLRGAPKPFKPEAAPAFPFMVGLWVALGWALLLDTFALLPVELYRWGFSPWAVGVFLVLVLLPWALRGGAVPKNPWTVGALLAVAGFVVLRLPSGNLWDAVLDPWLWLAAHAMLLRSAAARWRG
jgi:hypothetical protein